MGAFLLIMNNEVVKRFVYRTPAVRNYNILSHRYPDASVRMETDTGKIIFEQEGTGVSVITKEQKDIMYKLSTNWGSSILWTIPAVANEIGAVAGYERGCDFREWATQEIRKVGDVFESNEEELSNGIGYMVKIVEPMDKNS